jgi:hypothetical protein
MRHWDVTKGKKVGVIGLGGLGHMAIKFAHALGAHVVVFTTSPNKKEDALRLGTDDVVISRDTDHMRKHRGSFDFILDAVSAEHNINAYIQLLRRDGNITIVGAPDKPHAISAFSLLLKRRSLSGSLIGGIDVTTRKRLKLYLLCYKLVVSHSDDDIFVIGDKNRIAQVIYNLLENALKFTSEGVVSIDVARKKKKQEDHQEEVKLLRILAQVSIQKYSQGYLQNFPASPLVEQDYGCIFLSIIEAHGGKIWAQNHNDQGKSGATFSFSLPRLPPKPLHACSQYASKGNRGTSCCDFL